MPAEIGVFSVYVEILSVTEQLWCRPVVPERGTRSSKRSVSNSYATRRASWL